MTYFTIINEKNNMGDNVYVFTTLNVSNRTM